MSDDPTRKISETYTTVSGDRLDINRVVYHDDDGRQHWVEQQKINGEPIGHITRHADGRVNVHGSTFLQQGHRIDHEGYKNDSGSSSGCYIATAVIQGHLDIDLLSSLKSWRYQVLEKSKCGMSLSNHYRHTAPALAPYVAERARLSVLLRNLLIKPAISLVDKRAHARLKIGYDIALYLIFVTGLTIAEVLRRIERV